LTKVTLTNRFVETIKAKVPSDYFDSKTPGLGLRVSPAGHKAWSLIFTAPTTGKRARLSLGTFPATSLADARSLAIEARGKVEAGVDPRAVEASPTAAMTVADLVASYLSLHARGLRSAGEIERRLRFDVLPVIGGLELAKLHRRDVHRVLDRIIERGSPATARKLFADLRTIIRFAVGRGYLDHDIMTGMKAAAPKIRERFLTEDEIRQLWAAWPGVFGEEVALALRLALVTGQRIGEILGMTVTELDLANAVWTIPPERSKNKFSHTVPLTPLAMNLVARAEAIDGRLFRVSVVKVAQTINRWRERLPVDGWTAHDLRRTACTHMAMLGVSPLIIGNVVNHRGTTRSSITLSTYVRYSFDKERRDALSLWADRLSAIVSGHAAKIIPLARVQT
jgi:integrase